ncbi:restriction endonuclease subunit S [Escherichia coli]|uniref:restriction endonuclease subunit S n=1 Tax=Escherichia coli TaxID=562 RepID=UPI0019CF81CC|nr:restriction endonuclease subunit S [Escherichia coli]MBN6105457.1 restriction endonuclease subunit S [Escherichia coli]MBN6124824.1 restriction endonuclease subunit S [Escherichia coli]MBN6139541.1 restriction endonuclease subunit S [Escherichia coli]MBN6295249.1 restriction endonuclease subunit S [Escherichia coli]MCU0021055.1 restriction endonuclease subunit S [Escherichia coli]
MVPKGWSVFRLEDIVIRTQLGTTERGMSEDPLTTLIPLIKMGNLGWGSVNFNKVEYIEQSLINDSFLLKKGDFLFNTRNTPDLVGKSAVWDEDYTATFDNNINRIVFNKKVYTNFIAYYLNTGKGKSAIQSLPAGSTSVAAIYWKDLKNIQLLLPSLGEQQKIVQILSTWDKSIVVTEKLLANSQRQKKALMQQLLTGKKRLLDENGVRFSGEWEFKRISEIATRVQRKNDAAEHPILTISSLSGFVRQDERYSRYMAGESVKNYILLKKGEFAYNKGNSKTYEFGCIFDLEAYEAGLVPHVYVCFRLKNGLSHRYFKYLFEADYLKPQLGALVNTGVRNNGLLNIKPTEFMQTKVPVPCFEEQESIADMLYNSSRTIRVLQDKLACLKDEKKALMQQLLTGKRRVKVDEAVAE